MSIQPWWQYINRPACASARERACPGKNKEFPGVGSSVIFVIKHGPRQTLLQGLAHNHD